MQELHAGYVASAVWAAIQNRSLPDDLDWMDVVRRLSHFVVDLEFQVQPDPPPLVSMLANLLSRGLPTLPSLYIERKLERQTGLISCRPAGNTVVAAYTGRFECDRPQDLYKMIGRSFCVVAPGATLDSSPGYGFPEFGTGEDDTRFDSEAERDFWEGPLKETLGPGGIQLALRQRPLDSIAGRDFKEQRVDVAVGLPGAIHGATPAGIVFEVDGPTHRTTVRQDQRRDEGCLKAGWAATYRRQLWNNEIASASIDSAHAGIRALLSHPYLRYANQNIVAPLAADDLGGKARIIALYPLAVARIQCVLLHLMQSGHLSNREPVWNIAILDRDNLGGVGKAACRDLRIWMRRLWKMFDPGVLIPIIRVTEISGEAEPRIGAQSVDVLIDVSVEMRYGTTRPDPPLPVCVSSAKRVVIRTDYYPKKGRRELLFGAPLTLKTDGAQLDRSLTFVLRNVFRKLEFRPKQIEIIKRALRNESVIALLPTGAGKSITYQIPALLQNGIVLVVDPIKSLMKDQDDNLKAIAISASTFINSMTTSRERRENTRLLSRGVFKFAFVSPERFIIREFRDALIKMKAQGKVYCAYVAVDEAHCVSEWGHDFRTAYLRLGANARRFCPTRVPELPLLALTGTASFEVLEDVRVELGHDRFNGDIDVRPDSMERRNLNYKVVLLDSPSKLMLGTSDIQAKSSVGDLKLQRVTAVANNVCATLGHQDFTDFIKNEGGSGLIFCPHARWKHGAQGVLGSFVDAFPEITEHIGLYYGSAEETGRDANFDPVRTQDDFKRGKLRVLACTKAFGMGIDKPDVRFTVHYNIPPSLESFYQEAGRAGRDGEEAQCWVMYCPTVNPADPERTVDNSINYSFHKSTFPGAEIETRRLFELLDYNRSPAQSPCQLLSGYFLNETGVEYVARPWIKEERDLFRVYINHPEYPSTQVYIDFPTTGDPRGRVQTPFPDADSIVSLALDWLHHAKPEDAPWREWMFSKAESQYAPGIESVIEETSQGEKVPMVVYFENGLLGSIAEYLEINELDVRKAFQYAASAEEFINQLGKARSLDADRKRWVTDIFPQVRMREHTFRAVYRLTLLGVVDDFEADYANGTLTIWVGSLADGAYTERLADYIRSHAPKDVPKFVGRAKEGGHASELRRCCSALIEFVYERVAKQRVTALQYMEQTTRQGISDANAFQEQVTNFFDSSYLPILRPHLKEYSERLIFEIWADTGAAVSKLSHLLGACNRLLPENPNNGAFHALRGFAIALLGYPPEDVINEFEVAVKCFQGYGEWTRQDAHRFLLEAKSQLMSVNPKKAVILDAVILRDHASWLHNFVQTSSHP